MIYNFLFNIQARRNDGNMQGSLKAGDDLEFLPPGKIGGV